MTDLRAQLEELLLTQRQAEHPFTPAMIDDCVRVILHLLCAELSSRISFPPSQNLAENTLASRSFKITFEQVIKFIETMPPATSDAVIPHIRQRDWRSRIADKRLRRALADSQLLTLTCQKIFHNLTSELGTRDPRPDSECSRIAIHMTYFASDKSDPSNYTFTFAQKV